MPGIAGIVPPAGGADRGAIAMPGIARMPLGPASRARICSGGVKLKSCSRTTTSCRSACASSGRRTISGAASSCISCRPWCECIQCVPGRGAKS
jgi:hypothetical protein